MIWLEGRWRGYIIDGHLSVSSGAINIRGRWGGGEEVDNILEGGGGWIRRDYPYTTKLLLKMC